jgi:DNA mismatch repair protein MSH4
VILAQIGCFVPAKHATVPVRDRILSRLGTSDDMEHNMSTFFTEMKEISYLLANLTDKSLVVIDELGRGTSTIDGTCCMILTCAPQTYPPCAIFTILGLSLAFAIAEHLLDTPAMTLFVTHYPQITSLAQMYPNVKNVHMKTSIEISADAQGHTSSAPAGMKYLHEVSTGPCDMKSGYGIIMAEQSGFPEDVLDDARTLRNVVKEKFPVLIQHSGHADKSLAALSTILQHLQLLKSSTLDSRALQLYLHNMRDRIPLATAQEMLKKVDKDSENATRAVLTIEERNPASTADVDAARASKVARVEE